MMINTSAEQSALGCILAAPQCADEVLAIAPPDMYGVPKHADIATVIADMASTKDPIDPQTVLARLITLSLAEKVGGGAYLLTLMERAWSVSHATAYAEQVRDAFQMRRTAEAAERLSQRLEAPDADLATILALHQVEVEEIAELARPVHTEPAPTIADLLANPVSYDWLVEGLLERGDRLMLTGAEGGGKSVLLRQMATCLAAGLHPFTAEKIDPVNVLVVDCENSRRQNQRRYGPMVELAERMARKYDRQVDWDRLRITVRPDGLELTGRDDPVWLDRIVTASRPDVVVIGPLYRLHAQNINDELAARQLTVVLDTLRARHGVALLIEAHAGHAEDSTRKRKMRPTGSSLFMRWPEFGFGLRRSEDDKSESSIPLLVDVVSWRGARDERDWPQMLRRGQGTSMPWLPHDPADPTNFRPKWTPAA